MAPQPEIQILLSQWPVVLVVGIMVARLAQYVAGWLRTIADNQHRIERAIRDNSAQQEVIRLLRENEWLKAQLAHEGPGSGFRKAAPSPPPPPQGSSTWSGAPRKPRSETRRD